VDDFIVNNENKKHSSYGMKSFIPKDECFPHFIINNETIHGFWDSVVKNSKMYTFWYGNGSGTCKEYGAWNLLLRVHLKLHNTYSNISLLNLELLFYQHNSEYMLQYVGTI
jgi:hypothetical protein